MVYVPTDNPLVLNDALYGPLLPLSVTVERVVVPDIKVKTILLIGTKKEVPEVLVVTDIVLPIVKLSPLFGLIMFTLCALL